MMSPDTRSNDRTQAVQVVSKPRAAMSRSTGYSLNTLRGSKTYHLLSQVVANTQHRTVRLLSMWRRLLHNARDSDHGDDARLDGDRDHDVSGTAYELRCSQRCPGSARYWHGVQSGHWCSCGRRKQGHTSRLGRLHPQLRYRITYREQTRRVGFEELKPLESTCSRAHHNEPGANLAARRPMPHRKNPLAMNSQHGVSVLHSSAAQSPQICGARSKSRCKVDCSYR